MQRRALLAGGAALAAFPAAVRAHALGAPIGGQAGAPAGFDEAAFAALVRDGYVFALPMLEVARVRDRALDAGQAPNRFVHRRTLAGPADREVTTPNNDTLYSNAFLDLRSGPATLTCPAAPGRYLSLALMDAWSNNFHIAGTRIDGGRAVTLVVATEAQAATLRPAPGARVVTSPTKWVWALARVLVDGPADLAAAHAVQDGITAAGAAASPFPHAPRREAPVRELLAQGQVLAGDVGVLKADMGAMMGFARRGLMMGLDLGDLSDPARIAAAEAAVQRTRAELRAPSGTPVQGWIYQPSSTGDFGGDYLNRARTAVTGLAALPPVEAMYMWSAGEAGAGVHDGRRSWRLDLPAAPVDAFWSLSLYERTAEGASFFAANPLNRYAVGDRTPGLNRDAQGGCTLWIGNADPGEARRANWLPAPAGPFALVMRAYLPRPELREGRWRLPPVRAA